MKSNSYRDSPGGSVGKNPPASAEDMDLILVRENTTCPGATEPERRNYRACVPELRRHNY